MLGIGNYLKELKTSLTTINNNVNNVSSSVTTTSNNVTSLQSTTAGKQKIQVFTSSGTWVKPSTTSVVHVFMCGGGGGGGQYQGAGGGSGYLVQMYVPVTGNVTVTIGSGGSGAIYPSTQSANGGNTSFGALIAYGGKSPNNTYKGGSIYYQHYGGDGGAGGGSIAVNSQLNDVYFINSPNMSTINFGGKGTIGSDGGIGKYSYLGGYFLYGGDGGDGYCPGGVGYTNNVNLTAGGGGGGWYPGVNAGNDNRNLGKGGQGYGAGGGGLAYVEAVGDKAGNGAQGICIVTWFE